MAYPTRFIMFCHARTGSTLLGSLLASHPAIGYDGEAFKLYRQWRGIKALASPVVKRYPLLRLTWMAQRSARPVYGCKLAYYYVHNIRRTIAQAHEQGWLIVHAQRRNTFQEAISLIVARETTRYTRVGDKTPKGPDDPYLTIAPADLLARIRNIVHLNALEHAVLTNIPHVDVVYEDDLADPAGWDATAGRVFDALGLERMPTQTTVNKTWDRPYSDIVVNYAELVEAVRVSDYARFLEDALFATVRL